MIAETLMLVFVSIALIISDIIIRFRIFRYNYQLVIAIALLYVGFFSLGCAIVTKLDFFLLALTVVDVLCLVFFLVMIRKK